MSKVKAGPNFIKHIILNKQAKPVGEKSADGSANKPEVVTRFPPEPNGYLHIGHAKSICLNFGLAQEFSGRCHLRFDDTNPAAEDVEYVESIKHDVKWLGFSWGEHLFHASDYFDKIFAYTCELIRMGKAYVDFSTVEELRKLRGTLTEPGKESQYRNTSPDENLRLFEEMRDGKYEDGQCVLRAKIDLASSNMNLRDPILYRIRRVEHQMTGKKWIIYPMYDYAHPLSDMLEGITHSICTLEFEDHRPLYDWILDVLQTPCHPQQIEFSRLNLDYTVMSKRKLLQLVEEKIVEGWDDPRMPTIQGMRRRGYTPESIRHFCERIGVTKKDSIISLSTLEHSVRENLDEISERAMCVIDPVKVVITNLPADHREVMSTSRHPKKKELGDRQFAFTREVFIEREDFMEEYNPDFFRLIPGGEVRLRNAYVIKCEKVIKDNSGQVTELQCTYDPETKGGHTPEGREKVKGIIHWVSATESLACEVRLYDRFFSVADPDGDKEKSFLEFMNPDSLKVFKNARIEASAGGCAAETHLQFERQGFFCADLHDHKPQKMVFNRTVTLKDHWEAASKS